MKPELEPILTKIIENLSIHIWATNWEGGKQEVGAFYIV